MTKGLQQCATGSGAGLDRLTFQRALGEWYRENARVLPWRGIEDAYATWVSEVMLQQTRVATVMERYSEFMERFPTVGALAAGDEQSVLALWSGLGYYRRARLLHRGSQFVVRELGGVIPRTAAALRELPGVGEYTSAAIASIAFGERVAVVDGNVERVLLRVLGRAEDKSSAGRAVVKRVARSLMPALEAEGPAGEHNQAMMELGATVCLPRGPLCLQCPLVELCATRGEHATAKRAVMHRRQVAHLLLCRQKSGATEVLLERRSASASLMAGMLELPPLQLQEVEGLTPVMQVKHAITNTLYDVGIFTGHALQEGISARNTAPLWIRERELAEMPLTGLTRKVLKKRGLM